MTNLFDAEQCVFVWMGSYKSGNNNRGE